LMVEFEKEVFNNSKNTSSCAVREG